MFDTIKKVPTNEIAKYKIKLNIGFILIEYKNKGKNYSYNNSQTKPEDIGKQSSFL